MDGLPEFPAQQGQPNEHQPPDHSQHHQPTTEKTMPSTFEIIKWLLRKAGTTSVEHLLYCINNPLDAGSDLWGWIKNNKLTCAAILGGILVIAVPPAIGFSAIGPVAGTIAAGWQSAIGNVAAGSLFAIIQSWSMTGVFTSIGAGIISAGMGWCLVTRDYKSMFGRLIQSYMHDHRKVLRRTLGTICEMRRILFRIDTLARAMAVEEHTRILALVDEINRLFARIVEIKNIHTLMQRLDTAIDRDAPEDEVMVLLEELRSAFTAFCDEDATGASLPDEWVACLALADLRCDELREATRSLRAGPDLRELVEQLERRASELLQMTLEGTET